MRLTSLVSLPAALLLAAPVAAQSTTQVGAASTTAARAKPAEKKICKRLETSGTRMAERVCLTKEEWKKVEELD